MIRLNHEFLNIMCYIMQLHFTFIYERTYIFYERICRSIVALLFTQKIKINCDTHHHVEENEKDT